MFVHALVNYLIVILAFLALCYAASKMDKAIHRKQDAWMNHIDDAIQLAKSSRK